MLKRDPNSVTATGKNPNRVEELTRMFEQKPTAPLSEHQQLTKKIPAKEVVSQKTNDDPGNRLSVHVDLIMPDSNRTKGITPKKRADSIKNLLSKLKSEKPDVGESTNEESIKQKRGAIEPVGETVPSGSHMAVINNLRGRSHTANILPNKQTSSPKAVPNKSSDIVSLQSELELTKKELAQTKMELEQERKQRAVHEQTLINERKILEKAKQDIKSQMEELKTAKGSIAKVNEALQNKYLEMQTQLEEKRKLLKQINASLLKIIINLISERNAKLIKMHLECGFDVNISDDITGKTALHYVACQPSNEELLPIAKELLDNCYKKANPTAIDNSGSLALHYAALQNNFELVARLLFDGEQKLRCNPLTLDKFNKKAVEYLDPRHKNYKALIDIFNEAEKALKEHHIAKK
jgi:hypothetical protein